MRRKSCLTFLLNSNHRISFKSRSESEGAVEGAGAEAELCCSHRGISWTVTLLSAPCLPPSHSTLKFSISALWDEFVSVRLSPMSSHGCCFPLAPASSPQTRCVLFFLLLLCSLREGTLWDELMVVLGCVRRGLLSGWALGVPLPLLCSGCFTRTRSSPCLHHLSCFPKVQK